MHVRWCLSHIIHAHSHRSLWVRQEAMYQNCLDHTNGFAQSRFCSLETKKLLHLSTHTHGVLILTVKTYGVVSFISICSH